MTVNEIRTELEKQGKRVSRWSLYQYFGKFKIKPAGARQCPQQFPPDSAQRILVKLGLTKKRNGRRGGAR